MNARIGVRQIDRLTSVLIEGKVRMVWICLSDSSAESRQVDRKGKL